jgi:small ligand-binding sensory domain FIST
VKVRIAASISTREDPFEAGLEAAGALVRSLEDNPADLAVVFASGAHLVEPRAMLDAIHGTLAPRTLIGCGAGGVLGAGQELEAGTALAAWAASFDDACELEPFHATVSLDGPPEGLPPLGETSGAIVLSDPYSFPVDPVLAELSVDAPGVPVLGGVASGITPQGDGALFLDGEIHDQGAVGVGLHGIEMLPCVSQGAAPLGREVTITAADGNVIEELAGRPALETAQEIISGLSLRERALLAGGLLIGIVIDGGKPEYEQGDFLVRGVLGADPDSGAIAVGAPVRRGQVIRLHARDAQSADEDLRNALRLRREALAGRPPAGAVVFACNGRGQAMFGGAGWANHDAAAIDRELGGAPTAGFFAAGEIGPVGGRSFLHGFTATVAVFPG